MNISLIGYGTRGDIQPVMILADALRQRGHAVRVLAAVDLTPLLARAGLPHLAIPIDWRVMLSDPKGQAMLARGDINGFFRLQGRVEHEQAAGISQAIIDGCDDADVIVSDALMLNRAGAMAAVRGVPLVPLSMYPHLPTAEIASPFITLRNLGPLNRFTHRLMLALAWKNLGHDINAMRTQLGLPPARRANLHDIMRERRPYLLSFSPHLSPRRVDWHDAIKVIGQIRFPPALRARIGEGTPPDGLQAWIESGDKPIYFGMGSMPVIDPAPMIAILRKVLSATKQRAVVAAGWSNLVDANDEQIRVVGAVDHDWLLPRCRAAVHHGGSGTVHSTLSAGLPTVVCSIVADQPYWGFRVAKLGVGATFPFKRFSEERLTEALRFCLRPETMERAKQLGSLLAAEDGLPAAVESVERLASMPGKESIRWTTSMATT